VLTLLTAVLLGVTAKVMAAGFGVEQTIAMSRFVAVSLIGGLLSSAVLAVLTVSLASTAARRDWDPDNVMAPLVTACGDMVTLPALYLASLLVASNQVSDVIAALGAAGAAGGLVWAARRGARDLQTIVRESVPVVIVAGVLSLVAGLLLEKQIGRFVAYPALLSLVPPFLASAGSLGGIVSNRLTSKLHLGVIEPSTFPSAGARGDVGMAYTLTLPVFALSSLVADLSAFLADLASPGPFTMLGVAVAGGLLATTCAMAVAYWSAIASYRLGIDPDNVGIPLVTSSIDLVGSFSFILAVVVLV
jgi:mgtE-like transporter